MTWFDLYKFLPVGLEPEMERQNGAAPYWSRNTAVDCISPTVQCCISSARIQMLNVSNVDYFCLPNSALYKKNLLLTVYIWANHATASQTLYSIPCWILPLNTSHPTLQHLDTNLLCCTRTTWAFKGTVAQSHLIDWIIFQG